MIYSMEVGGHFLLPNEKKPRNLLTSVKVQHSTTFVAHRFYSIFPNSQSVSRTILKNLKSACVRSYIISFSVFKYYYTIIRVIWEINKAKVAIPKCFNTFFKTTLTHNFPHALF